MVKFVSLGIHEETKTLLASYSVGKESWDETLARILRCWGEVNVMVPMREADVEFLAAEHRKLGFTSVNETVQRLFAELVALREAEAQREEK